MKSLLVSIKPKWVAKILNGEKTIEVRKSNLKCDLPIDVYIYCTKDKELLHKNCADIYWVEDTNFKAKNKKLGLETQPFLNGKVVAKFTLNKVEEIKFNDKNIQEKSCLSEDELFDYLFDNTPYQEDMRKGYAWHIDNLEIFDEPKELSEFNKYGCKQYDNDVCADYGERGHLYANCFYHLTKAPQNYCYIETEK